jgi:hypothetical protein
VPTAELEWASQLVFFGLHGRIPHASLSIFPSSRYPIREVAGEMVREPGSKVLHGAYQWARDDRRSKSMGELPIYVVSWQILSLIRIINITRCLSCFF